MNDVTRRGDQLFDDWAEDLKLADEAIVDLYERLDPCGL